MIMNKLPTNNKQTNTIKQHNQTTQLNNTNKQNQQTNKQINKVTNKQTNKVTTQTYCEILQKNLTKCGTKNVELALLEYVAIQREAQCLQSGFQVGIVFTEHILYFILFYFILLVLRRFLQSAL